MPASAEGSSYRYPYRVCMGSIACRVQGWEFLLGSFIGSTWVLSRLGSMLLKDQMDSNSLGFRVSGLVPGTGFRVQGPRFRI